MIWSLVESPTYAQRSISPSSARPKRCCTIQRTFPLVVRPNQPLMWMLLTVAVMPAARMMRTHGRWPLAAGG